MLAEVQAVGDYNGDTRARKRAAQAEEILYSQAATRGGYIDEVFQGEIAAVELAMRQLDMPEEWVG